MYWVNKEQALFIELMDGGMSAADLSVRFKKSMTAIRSKMTRIKRARSKMADLGITEKLLTDTVHECCGYAPEIRKILQITPHMLISFVHTYPSIGMKLTDVENKDFKKRKKKSEDLKIDETVFEEGRNYLKQAEKILGNRISIDKKFGRMLDGNRASVKQILEAAGINDPAFYV